MHTIQEGKSGVSVSAHPKTGVNPSPLSKAEVTVAEAMAQTVKALRIEEYVLIVSGCGYTLKSEKWPSFCVICGLIKALYVHLSSTKIAAYLYWSNREIAMITEMLLFVFLQPSRNSAVQCTAG